MSGNFESSFAVSSLTKPPNRIRILSATPSEVHAMYSRICGAGWLCG